MSIVSERPAQMTGERSATLWTRHLGLLAVSLAVLGLAFWPDVRAAVIVWWIYPAYSHCFLILPISAWLIWERRGILKAAAPSFSPWVLAGVVPVFALWLVGEFASITEARQFAFIGFVEIFIAAILGWNIFRGIMFACLYLLFLVPTGQYLIPLLQAVTAKFVDLGLTALSIPFFRDGLVFELVNGRYEIAEACAGLRFMVATVALGVLFAHLTFRNKTKIALFLASCVIVPVIGNGIRALVTVMVANYTNNKVAAGFDHIVYGWAFAVAIIMLILYVGSRYADPETPPAAADRAPAPRAGTAMLAATLGGIALTLGLLLSISHYAQAATGGVRAAALDQALAGPGWADAPPGLGWQVQFSEPAAQLQKRFAEQNGATPVDVDIHYYARGAKSASMLASLNRAWQVESWHPIAHRTTQEDAGGTRIAVDESIITAGNSRRMVWTSYWLDGTFATSSPLVRLLEFRAGMMHGHTAIVVLSTPISGSDDEARDRLARFLASRNALATGLARAGAGG